ncbi:MAG: protein jag [Lachnospiraceae bacterium]|nr:protein jag [Lachnospiraceae bacterium]MCI9659863.1 protein jag [Lachnospiraceae bacterium]
MEYREFSGKTLEDAVTEAKISLEATSENLEYEVIEKGSTGFLGIGSKPAKIRARKLLNARERAEEFLAKVFEAMQISVHVNIVENTDEKIMNIDLSGEDMGVLIGKRGQTLDSLQYLVSLVVNKGEEEYVRVKVDTENYRQRRKDTLENLAKNISFKVRKNGKTVTLEPMNPYERRVIHSALQNDRYVETHSEGEEPFRRVVVSLKEGVKVRENNNNRHRRYGSNKNYNRNNHKKGGGRE